MAKRRESGASVVQSAAQQVIAVEAAEWTTACTWDVLVASSSASMPPLQHGQAGPHTARNVQVPKLMELVGLAYTTWFVYRYLLFKVCLRCSVPLLPRLVSVATAQAAMHQSCVAHGNLAECSACTVFGSIKQRLCGAG